MNTFAWGSRQIGQPMTMMKRHWGPVVLSLTALHLLCNNVTPDTTYDGDPALISIENENGEYSSGDNQKKILTPYNLKGF